MHKNIGILDVGLGNVSSVQRMIETVGGESIRIDDPDKLQSIQKLIVPGVGSFGKAMDILEDLDFPDSLKSFAQEHGNFILGICLGMQLCCEYSEEGHVKGLGLVKGRVKHFSNIIGSDKYKVPHMGWNNVQVTKENSIFPATDEDTRFYFVHSYYVELHDKRDTFLSTNYIENFCSGFISENIIGVQFHPEKSHRYGKHLIENFIKL